MRSKKTTGWIRLRVRRTTTTTRVLVAGAAIIAVSGVLTVGNQGGGSETGQGGHQHPVPEPRPVASDTALPRSGWTVTADSQQANETPAVNAIDGNINTLWHTQYVPTTPGLPHWFTIDMNATNIVTGLRYQPRTGMPNGNIGSYQIHVSTDGSSWGNPVATGTFGDDAIEKTIPFNRVPARFVRLTALSEAGNRGPWSSAAEINITGNPAPVLPRTGWTVTADSQQAGETPATNVLDGNTGTIWHTQYYPTTPGLPHTLTIDMKASNVLSGLRYQPRTDHVNGNIGGFQIHLSADGTNWGSPIATGTFGDGPAEKAIPFTPTAARFVRLTALTEAGNRGPWSAAAEINLTGNPVPTLPRAGWTVTADSQQANETPVFSAIDGNVNTMWHTQYVPTTPGLPHTYTIDMHTSNSVTGLRYLPRQDGRGNGNVGNFQIHVSADGTSWGNPVATGTFADNAVEKVVSFNPTTARYVRLTALTEAGNRGVWSAAAEINLTGATPLPAPNVGGAWGATIGFPIIPVGAAQMPNGTLLTWSAQFPYDYAGGTGLTQTATMNPVNGTVSKRVVSETGHDMFCPGTARLADGGMLVNGGSDNGKTSIYNPVNDTWNTSPNMNIGRGYQSSVTLSNGNVFTIGGSWSGGEGGKSGEVWSPGSGWRQTPGLPAETILTNDPVGIFRSDNHAWMFAISNERVFQAGPSKRMTIMDTKGNGSFTVAGNRADDQDAMNGSALMYDIGKILTVGGAPAYDSGTASNRAYAIDVNNGVTARRVGDMAYGRSFSHAVALPDGKVVVIGGTPDVHLFSDTAAVYHPEMWDPATETFTTLAPMSVPRTYHSTALLLPDGRIFAGGGGLCGTGASCQVNHPDAQIFSPPYLFKSDGTPAPRPAITNAPATLTLGTNATVTTDRAVSAFSLVRMGSVTHGINTDQRRVPLTTTAANGNSYTLAVPSDSGVLVPGYYMLFAMDANGVPSVAASVKVG